MFETYLGQAQGGWTSFLPLILIFVVFYFFIIRPQQKKSKEQKEFMNEIDKGQTIITTSGIYGKIVEIQENTVILQVDKSTQIKFDKNSISAQASRVAQKMNEQK